MSDAFKLHQSPKQRIIIIKKQRSRLRFTLTFLNSGDAPAPSAHVQVWYHSRQSRHTYNCVKDVHQINFQLLNTTEATKYLTPGPTMRTLQPLRWRTRTHCSCCSPYTRNEGVSPSLVSHIFSGKVPPLGSLRNASLRDHWRICGHGVIFRKLLHRGETWRGVGGWGWKWSGVHIPSTMNQHAAEAKPWTFIGPTHCGWQRKKLRIN